jgi:chemotaxis protein MotB
MSAHKKRKHDDHGAEHHVDERWMASYMDMVTVLMCLFIVLFAMSTVDAKKYEQLKNSLATGFGTTVTEKIDTAKGVVVPPELANKEDQAFSPIQEAAKETQALEQLKEKVQAALDAAGQGSAVDMVIDQRGLTVRLVGGETFFQPNVAVLTPTADEVLAAMGPVLNAIPNNISVEGNANPCPACASSAYATDWDLSSARATAVVRFFNEAAGIPGSRLGASGFGSFRPITDSATPEDAAKNRRVDVVVVSGAPDNVRALIPNLAADPAALKAALDSINSPAPSTSSTTAPTEPPPAKSESGAPH